MSSRNVKKKSSPKKRTNKGINRSTHDSLLGTLTLCKGCWLVCGTSSPDRSRPRTWVPVASLQSTTPWADASDSCTRTCWPYLGKRPISTCPGRCCREAGQASPWPGWTGNLCPRDARQRTCWPIPGSASASEWPRSEQRLLLRLRGNLEISRRCYKSVKTVLRSINYWFFFPPIRRTKEKARLWQRR